MKKILLFLAGLLVLLFLILFTTPVLFKGKIDRIIKQEVNKSVNAKVDYGRYSLSLFKSFPDFSATMKHVSVIGIDDFEGDTLAYFEELSARVDLASVFSDDGITIESISINSGSVQLIVNEDGKANWNIGTVDATPNEQPATSAKVKEEKGLKLLLQNIDIHQVDFAYLENEDNYFLEVYNIDANLKGEMDGAITKLKTHLATSSINFHYDDVAYLEKKPFQIETVLLANLETYDFQFDRGNSTVNKVPLIIDGGFSMPNDSLLFDVDFEIPEIELNDVLELLPNAYKKYLKDVTAEADVSFVGKVLGAYYQSTYPAINVDFVIQNGKVKYPDLPEQLTINVLKASIDKPVGILDSMSVGISNMEIVLGENPFKAKAVFNRLFSDPGIDMSLNGKIDLATLNKVLPLGDTQLSGIIDSKTKIRGRYSELKNNDFENFYSKGIVGLKEFELRNKNVPQGMTISDARLSLDNQNVTIRNLKGNLGRSDFSVTGKIENVITYALADDELLGNIRLNSRLFDANQFMQKVPQTDATNEVYVEIDTTITSDQPFELPEKVNLKIVASIDHLLFDQMDITRFNGSLKLSDQQLEMDQLSMNVVGGKMQMNGNLIADGREFPDVDLGLNITDFDLPTAHQQITMVRKYLPFAAKSQGKFSSRLFVKSKLADDFKMMISTVTANGSLSTKNLKLINTSYFQNLRSVLQYQKLRNVEISDFTARFSINDGNLNLRPFSTQVAGQPIKLGGSYNLGGDLDLRVDAKVDKELLSGDIQQMIAYIPGHQRVTTVDVGLDITGDAKKPDVKVDTDKIQKQVINQVKNSSAEELQDAAKKLLNQFFK